MQDEQLRYPIGKYEPTYTFTEVEKKRYILVIAEFPGRLKTMVDGFTPENWFSSYRQEGWNATQIVNHIADSHMNAFIRFKLGVTEDNPTIKPYDEKLWAKTADGLISPPDASIKLIENLHLRWVMLLKSLSLESYERTVYRPDTDKLVKLSFFLGLYAWHCNHHLAHLQLIKNKN